MGGGVGINVEISPRKRICLYRNLVPFRRMVQARSPSFVFSLLNHMIRSESTYREGRGVGNFDFALTPNDMCYIPAREIFLFAHTLLARSTFKSTGRWRWTVDVDLFDGPMWPNLTTPLFHLSAMRVSIFEYMSQKDAVRNLAYFSREILLGRYHW